MNYEQHNPLPLPDGKALQSVQTTMDSVFDWEYALKRKNLLALYEKGKANAWNATDLDWSIEVDIEKMVAERNAVTGGQLFNQRRPELHRVYRRSQRHLLRRSRIRHP